MIDIFRHKIELTFASHSHAEIRELLPTPIYNESCPRYFYISVNPYHGLGHRIWNIYTSQALARAFHLSFLSSAIESHKFSLNASLADKQPAHHEYDDADIFFGLHRNEMQYNDVIARYNDEHLNLPKLHVVHLPPMSKISLEKVICYHQKFL